MSRDPRMELDWADGTYSFRLGFGELVELQERTDAGPYVLLNRLIAHRWLVQDIPNVMRLGLIGGGMDPVAALKLVRTYVEGRPLLENHQHALAILTVALMGAPDEPPGE